MGGEQRTLFDVAARMAASLADVFLGKAEKLEMPDFDHFPHSRAMPRQEFVLSGYRGMWLFAMFDLPVTTAKARKRYAQFRKVLIEQGFSMLQYSVYARYCASEEMAVALPRRESVRGCRRKDMCASWP